MSKPQVFPYDFETSKKFCNIFDERKHKEKLRLVQAYSPQHVFQGSCLPPQEEHVIAIEDVELFHSGCLWKSMWAIMMEQVRGGGGKEKREEKEGP